MKRDFVEAVHVNEHVKLSALNQKIIQSHQLLRLLESTGRQAHHNEFAIAIIWIFLQFFQQDRHALIIEQLGYGTSKNADNDCVGRSFLNDRPKTGKAVARVIRKLLTPFQAPFRLPIRRHDTPNIRVDNPGGCVVSLRQINRSRTGHAANSSCRQP